MRRGVTKINRPDFDLVTFGLGTFALTPKILSQDIPAQQRPRLLRQDGIRHRKPGKRA